jgi:ribonuclease HII
VCALRIVEPERFPFTKVRDSKALTRRMRENIAREIEQASIWYFGIVSNLMIDRIGIQAANVLAMELALKGFEAKVAVVHADHVGGAARYRVSHREIAFHTHGESKFPEIAAASILAKVYRDALMRTLAREFPQYGFERHVGYGTKAHRAAIERFGITPVHRTSFIH